MGKRIKRALSRSKYAATGAAIGAGIGGLVNKNLASTGGALGALVGAIIGEKSVTVSDKITEVKDREAEDA